MLLSHALKHMADMQNPLKRIIALSIPDDKLKHRLNYFSELI